MELNFWLNFSRRWWRLLLLTTVAGMAFGVFIAFDRQQAPSYKSTVHLLIQRGTGPILSGSWEQAQSPGMERTYQILLAEANVVKEARSSLTSGFSEAELEKVSVAADLLPNSSILQIIGSGPDPKVVKELTEAVALSFIDHISRIQQSRFENELNQAAASLSAAEREFAQIDGKLRELTSNRAQLAQDEYSREE